MIAKRRFDIKPIVSIIRKSINPWSELGLWASICMELSWGVLWYQALLRFGKELEYIQVFLILGGLLLLSFTATRLINYLDINMNFRRILMFVILLICFYIGLKHLLYVNDSVNLKIVFSRFMDLFNNKEELIPAELLMMAVVLIVWGRAISLAGKREWLSSVMGKFRTGVIMFFIYGLIIPIIDRSPAIALYLFLFSGLIAMSSTRINIISRMRGGQRIPFDNRWILGISLVVFVILGVTIMVEISAKSGIFALISQFYSRAIVLIFYILTLIFSPFVYLLFKLLDWIGRILYIEGMSEVFDDILTQMQGILEQLDETVGNWFENTTVPDLSGLVKAILAYRAYFLLGFISLCALGILIWTLRRKRIIQETSDVQDFQSAGEANVFDLLKSAFRNGFKQVAEDLGNVLGLWRSGGWYRAARIRLIYARLMDLSRKLDSPRPLASTPLEFLPKLVDLFPDNSSDLEIITQAYVQVRYGDIPERKEEVDSVEEAWKRLKEVGRKVIKGRKA